MQKLAVLGGALAMCMSWASAVRAVTVTIYTDKTQWESALGGQFLSEDFADSQLNDGVSFVSTESGHINPAEECYQDVLASQSQNEPMTIWSFSPEIAAYGGDWALGGPGGSGNSLLVYIADFSLYVGAISNNYGGEFWGFISDTPFTSVRLVGGPGSHQQNYRLDNMVYSQVPEPAAMSLLTLGGLMLIRRRTA
ncbi:MAG TPA: PEP-CTERM sorting domain-containing protein [Phycisphaerae bacterium]|nr:PEP-CTERM sorting domain-containing protein [Phycisphaerae bacterium]HRR84845.1 PEP-CTERM sorting domain-containing protein [Phycisphaerae bacterium]